MGLSAAGRYFGPRPCSGAGEDTPRWVLVSIIDNESLSSAALADWESCDYPGLLLGIAVGEDSGRFSARARDSGLADGLTLRSMPVRSSKIRVEVELSSRTLAAACTPQSGFWILDSGFWVNNY